MFRRLFLAAFSLFRAEKPIGDVIQRGNPERGGVQPMWTAHGTKSHDSELATVNEASTELFAPDATQVLPPSDVAKHGRLSWPARDVSRSIRLAEKTDDVTAVLVGEARSPGAEIPIPPEFTSSYRRWKQQRTIGTISTTKGKTDAKTQTTH
jgi:hypothetical protein